MKHPRIKRWLKRLVGLLTLCIITVAASNAWVLMKTKDRIAGSIADAPAAPVALVLGTGKIIHGNINRHFAIRIAAAAQLYHAGKVRHLLLSGDNGAADYNEPADMRDALLAKGVPASAITLDFAGFRTLDSIVRARDIFGVKKCIIITDDFHLPRSLYLARHFGVEATGVAGSSVSWEHSKKTRFREMLARVKMLLDLYVLRTEPKFGGKPEPLAL